MAAKRTTSPADAWGTPEHDAWRARTLGSPEVRHPHGCRCGECLRGIERATRYLEWIRRVDR